MADVLLTATSPGVARRLDVLGQDVIATHRQLAAIIGSRLGRAHAQFLGRPEITADGGVRWFASGAGEAVPADQLSEGDRAALRMRAQQLFADLEQLANRLEAEGPSAALVGHTLRLALVTPQPWRLYAQGTQPILVLWGHAAPDQPVPTLPESAHWQPPAEIPAQPESPESIGAPPVTPLEAAAEAVETGSAETSGGDAPVPPPPVRRLWSPWLVPLLLLLLVGWLGWRALQPLPPVIVETPAPPSATATDPLAEELAREKDLRAELARLNKERDDRLAQCLALKQSEALEKPQAPAPQPEVSPPAQQPPSKPAEPGVPENKVTALPPPTPRPQVEAPAPIGEQPKPEIQKPVAQKPAPSKSAPEKKPASNQDVALAPSPPPVPVTPKSRCSISAAPGDEPEVVMIVDGSGSMSDSFPGSSSRMRAAQDSIENMVTGLPAPVDVALIDFSNCDQVRLDKFFSQPERPSLIREVRGLKPDRGTPLARSIERAGNIVSSGVESTIVVVTDGEDTCGRDPCAAARAVKARHPNVTINVIDLSDDSAGRATVQCIAAATGGKVLSPKSTLDMKNKVQQATRLPDTRNCQP